MLDDPYHVLGVGRNASDAELRSAYRRRALETHPDKGGIAESFRQVVEAFELLGDSVRRAAFEDAARNVGKPASASHNGNGKRSQPEENYEAAGGPSKRRKKEGNASGTSSSAAPSAPEAKDGKTSGLMVPSHGGLDAKELNIARLVREFFKMLKTSWTKHLREMPTATLAQIETFLQEGGCMDGDCDDFSEEDFDASGGTMPNEKGAGEEEDAAGAMVSLSVYEEEADEQDEADEIDGVANETNYLNGESTAMLALGWWDQNDAASGESDSETELDSCIDDDTQVPQTPATKANEASCSAVSASEVVTAVAAVNPTAIDTSATISATGACESPASQKPPKTGRGKTKLCGISKTKSGGYTVCVGIEYVSLISNTCHDLNTAIDVHIVLVRFRQLMIERVQAGVEFADTLREVDALVIAERHQFEDYLFCVSYRVKFFSKEMGKKINMSGQSRNVETAISVWKEKHQARHEARQKRRAEASASRKAAKEERQRRILERKQTFERRRLEREQRAACFWKEQRCKRVKKRRLKLTTSLLFCVRRILSTRSVQRKKMLASRWGVKTLPDGVETGSLHESDDCVCAVLQLSDGTLRRGPLRLSLKDAETDALDLARLQRSRGDAAACDELDRRDVAAMTGYFLELA
eukprot:TRINITY_DN14367_c0_g3_i1.p1 TRINITY_DN14367_c0_g3~~TRINITY_DN14367_c0_g3_i1.p1  ORF type:complete len:642 (+),score=140.16 TRINITY_DN14367_c0_g3_i1:158-2083(+)